jgi:prolyl oligopeptidase
VAEQNAATRDYLDHLPQRPLLRDRLDRMLAIGMVGLPVPRGRRVFFLRREGRANQPALLVREDGADRVLVDPNRLDAQGLVALDWWTVSPDGRKVAFGLSAGGDEQSVLHVVDADTGVEQPEVIHRCRGAMPTWLPDGSGFYYGRYPAPGSVPEGMEPYYRRIFFHALGTDPATDPEVFAPSAAEGAGGGRRARASKPPPWATSRGPRSTCAPSSAADRTAASWRSTSPIPFPSGGARSCRRGPIASSRICAWPAR